jgi:predicted small lipoprotein YifL
MKNGEWERIRRLAPVFALILAALAACGEPEGLPPAEAETEKTGETGEEAEAEETPLTEAPAGETEEAPAEEAAPAPEEPYRAESLPALAAYLEALPPNSRETAYRAALSGVDLSRLAEPETAEVPDGFKPFYDALRGRYAALDLDACTGATLAYYDAMQQDLSRRQDRDKIVSLVLPAEATRVGFHAFENCSSLESVVMPAGLRSIGQYAFAGCTSLERVELPASITGIDFAAFLGCRALASLVILAETPPALLSGGIDNWFGDVSEDFVITVPAGSVAAYKAADGWRRYAEKIQAKDEE